MADENRFTIILEQVRDYEFKVRFDWEGVADLHTDEPEPLGGQSGPNASRLVAAAVGNCLSASLLFCASKARTELGGIKTEVETTLARNERGRLRIGRIDVRINVPGSEGDGERLQRCLALFEDYCVVTESIRNGVPVGVTVVDGAGNELLASEGASDETVRG